MWSESILCVLGFLVGGWVGWLVSWLVLVFLKHGVTVWPRLASDAQMHRPPKCWDWTYVPPHPVAFFFWSKKESLGSSDLCNLASEVAKTTCGHQHVQMDLLLSLMLALLGYLLSYVKQNKGWDTLLFWLLFHFTNYLEQVSRDEKKNIANPVGFSL